MARGMRWVIAAGSVLFAAAAVYWGRTRLLAAPVGLSADQMVRKAWNEGSRVALDGRQTITMIGPDGKKVQVEAEVLTSADGRIRINYLSPPLKGVTIWETGDRTYRFNP